MAEPSSFHGQDARATRRKAKVYVGPAGWSYADWNGAVYPARRPRRFQPLAYLARYFNMIEVNSSFYRIPAPRLCEKWAGNVAPFEDFLFSVKLWQDFTHVRNELDRRALNEWHAAMAPMRRAGRLGAVLVQFPWSFKRTKENEKYLEELTRALAPDPLAIEVRHDSWNRDDYLGWLRERGYAFCNIDQPHLHHCLRPTDYVTAPVAYVRLHGRNAEHWFREDEDVAERYNYLYSKDELAQWVERLRGLIEKAEKILVVTNNHTEGRAVANAVQIQSMLADKKVEAPPTLVRAFPEVAPYTSTPPSEGLAGEEEQLELF